jgi:Ca2+-binding EF-hand superfamily protein
MQQMIDKADSDRDGMVTAEDFYAIITKKTAATY